MVNSETTSAMPNPGERPHDITWARQRIAAVRAEITSMGNNDSEYFELDQILGKVESGEITPEDGVTQATLIESRKSDH